MRGSGSMVVIVEQIAAIVVHDIAGKTRSLVDGTDDMFRSGGADAGQIVRRRVLQNVGQGDRGQLLFLLVDLFDCFNVVCTYGHGFVVGASELFNGDDPGPSVVERGLFPVFQAPELRFGLDGGLLGDRRRDLLQHVNRLFLTFRAS